MNSKRNKILILSAYFFLGITSLTAVVGTLFTKNSIHLSNEELISLGIWVNLPWSCKLLFSGFIDSIKIANSQRKSYLVIAGILGIIASLGSYDIAAGSHSHLLSFFGEYRSLLITGLLGTVGTVITKLLFDTLIIESVENDVEKAKIQLHTRNIFILGGLLGAVLSGPLAAHFSIQTVFAMSALSPVMILISSIFIKYSNASNLGEKKLIGVGVGFVLISTFLGLFLSDTHSQLCVFLFSMTLFSFMLNRYVPHLSTRAKAGFFVSLVALFLFRVSVGPGSVLTWYYIDVKGFTPQFLGTLNIIGFVSSIVFMTVFRKFLVQKDKIAKILIYLTIGGLILSLPDILIYYGYTAGISAKHLVLGDVAGAEALASISMIPLGILVALAAPETGKVTYLALTASLMNLALVCGAIISKGLNHLYVVSRGHYENLGLLLIWSLVISCGLSVMGIILLLLEERRNKTL